MSLAKLMGEVLAYLQADPGVAAIAGQRVYVSMIPQGDNGARAALVVNQLTAPSPRDLQNEIGLIESRWQFDCYGGESYADALALASMVDDALTVGFTGLDTITVQRCVRDDGPTDLSVQDGDRMVRRVSLGYLIYYEE